MGKNENQEIDGYGIDNRSKIELLKRKEIYNNNLKLEKTKTEKKP